MRLEALMNGGRIDTLVHLTAEESVLPYEEVLQEYMCVTESFVETICSTYFPNVPQDKAKKRVATTLSNLIINKI